MNTMFKHVRAYQDYPSASQHNKLVDIVGNLLQSFATLGFVSPSTGLAIRTGIGKSTGAAKEVYRAWCKESAGLTNSIECYFGGNTFEAAQTANNYIDVYCQICGGNALNAAFPRLMQGYPLFIAKFASESGEDEWWCINLFQATIDCDCYEA